MLGLGLGVDRASFVGGFDADYQAVLDRGTTLGYALPTGDALSGGDTLVKSLKSAGIWNKLDIFYVFATNGDSDFATLNWKTPAIFQATKVNAPTFTSLEGFTGDGASSYLNTNYNPNTNAINTSLNNVFSNTYVRSIGTDGRYMYGCVDGSFRGHHTGSAIAARLNSLSFTNTASYSAGFVGLRRNNAANYDQLNNATITNISDASVIVPSVIMNVFVRGGSLSGYSDAQASVFCVGAYLDNSEYLDYRTAIETYMDAIGKGVVA